MDGHTDAEQLLSIEGTVEKIIYSNEENGYTVCELLAFSDELYTLVGIMPYLAEGETIQAHGNWTVHPSFGRQFKVEIYEKQLPATAGAIQKYLSSGVIPGIGKVTAKRIVEEFGTDTFDVMENHPDWLASVHGISAAKADEIGKNFREQFGMRNVMMFCRDYFGPSTSVKIYHELGAGAVDVIKANPYVLCERINGIGFERADAVARSVGIARDSRDRIAAGVKYVLTYNAMQNGHVYVPERKLIPTADKLLGCGIDLISDVVNERCKTGCLVRVNYDEPCIYTKEYYEKESYITRKLEMLEATDHMPDGKNLSAIIRMTEAENDIEYARLQVSAISGAVNNAVFLLTGGPGTGKTTVVKAILRVFELMNLKIALCAPTGRAAKRLSQSAGRDAKTVHRMLEMEYGDSGEPVFRRDETNKLDEDVVIVDEASMLDTDIMYALLKAMSNDTRLILIGDADQLPPVGAGYVFRDMLASDRFTSITLTHIFRQAQDSLIVVNAHAINHGEYMDLDIKDSDFFFLPRQTDTDTVDTVVDLCKNRLPKRYNVTAFDSIQVITPSRKGEAGTEMLNARLQSALNPAGAGKREHKFRDGVFREGDKVMQIKNNYGIEWQYGNAKGTGVFNGDIGVIKTIDTVKEAVVVDFDGRVAEYDFTQLDELEMAYAITVHKSQGSEYPIVIIPLYRYTPKLLTRNLLYTAVTRAQAMVVLVGDAEISRAMIDNNIKTKRYTGLERMLGKYDE